MIRFVGSCIGPNNVHLEFVNVDMRLVPGDTFDIKVPPAMAEKFKAYLKSLSGIVFQATLLDVDFTVN